MPRLILGNKAIGMIPFIFETQGSGMEVNPGRFEYLKIMGLAMSKVETNDFLSVLGDDNLTLESMLLLLTGVKPLLLTFGTFNRGFCDVHDNDIGTTKASH